MYNPNLPRPGTSVKPCGRVCLAMRRPAALAATVLLVTAAVAAGAAAGPENPPSRSDAIDHRLRVLLVRGEAGAAHRFGRHRRRRHAVDEQPQRAPEGRRGRRQDSELAEDDRRRGHGGSQGTGRSHPHRPGVCRGRAAGRCAGGEDPGDRFSDRLWLQRMQRFSAGELRPLPRLTNPAHRREDDDRGVRAGHRDPAASLLRQHGRRAGAGARPGQQQSAGETRGESRQQGAGRRLDAVHPGLRAGRPVRGGRRPRRTGRRRGRSDGDRDLACAAASSSPSART